MTTRDIHHLNPSPHRLHVASFEPARRADGRIDHDLYAARARRERARVVNRTLHATSNAVAAGIRRGVLDPIRRRRRMRRTYDELTALDDRLLRDIGIRRDDIEAIAREAWRPQERERGFDIQPTQAASATPSDPRYREAA